MLRCQTDSLAASREKRKPGTGRALAAFDGDLGHWTGKPRQAGGKGVGTAEIVGWSSAGGRGPQRQLGLVVRRTEKIGGLLRPTPTLYGEAEITESSGSVSMTKGEAVSRLAVRLSPTPNGGTYPLCWTDKRRQRGTRKGKVVWQEALAGDRREIDAHCVGQVKTER